jgi:hypothetical protein
MVEPGFQGMQNIEGPSCWSVVNILLPLQLENQDGTTTPYFALAHWLLHRVPSLGEEIRVVGHRAKIERVTWGRDGKVTVALPEFRVQLDGVEALEREGWAVQPWEDEPPAEWLNPVHEGS